jgi:hypothetical protein
VLALLSRPSGTTITAIIDARHSICRRRAGAARNEAATRYGVADAGAGRWAATYDESEQIIGFHTMLQERLEMPFQTAVLGVDCERLWAALNTLQCNCKI